MGVLGSMLLSQDAVYLAREHLSESSFYKLGHQDIFQAILHLADAQNAVDLILLRDELQKRDKLEKAGGVAYLVELMEAVPTSANVEHYIQIVRERAVRRMMIEAAADIEKRAYRDNQDVDDLLDAAETRMLAVRHSKDGGQVREINDVLQTIVERLEELHQHPGQMTGLASGYYDLDDLTGGFQPGELVVIAARPSQGKTSFALNVLHHICAVQRRPAALFSMEMPAEQIVSNFLCIHNKLNTHDFRRGTLQPRDWTRLEASLDDLVGLPLYIYDAPSMRILDLRARARRIMHYHSVELIVIDYMQLMSGNRTHENRATEVAEISQGLKALARELSVPVLAVAQLSRRVEQEQRRPRMSDLRESGAIEQDADLIMLLHRPQEPTDDPNDLAGTEADLIVAKQRNGPTGVVPLVFQKSYLRFESRATKSNVP